MIGVGAKCPSCGFSKTNSTNPGLVVLNVRAQLTQVPRVTCRPLHVVDTGNMKPIGRVDPIVRGMWYVGDWS